MAKKFICDDKTAIVTTKYGTVKGYFYDQSFVFKGIPYGQAKRFHEAEPVYLKGVFDATNYGFVCPLVSISKPNGELNVPHRYWPTSEDCLNLNIWTPGLDNKKRTVAVWLHGGGFDFGSPIEQLSYEGGNMSKYADMVVVSIGHRLNCLGFLDVSSYGKEYANSANLGMDDIILALKWVRDNIALFGGNPNDVVIFGQSGGGMKVTTLLQMPAADGLYHKGIVMSGVCASAISDSSYDSKVLVDEMMNYLKITKIEELEEVPYESLAKAYDTSLAKLGLKSKMGATSSPRKNEFYYGNPLKYGFRKETESIPLMVGSVFGEFVGFIKDPYDKRELTFEDGIKLMNEKLGEDSVNELLPLFKKAYPKRNPVDLVKVDLNFRPDEIKYIKLRSSLNKNTYSYIFNQDFVTNGGKCPWHCCDLPYVFHNCELIENTQEEGVVDVLEEQVFKTFTTFMKTGNPNNPTIPNWNYSTPEEESVLLFQINPVISVNIDHELIPVLQKDMKKMMEKLSKQFTTEIQH